MGKETRQGCNGGQDNRINMTRDLSTLAAPVVGEVEVLPVSGTSVYMSGSTPLLVCTAISTFPSEVPRMAHAILTSVPGYIKKYVKDFISLLF